MRNLLILSCIFALFLGCVPEENNNSATANNSNAQSGDIDDGVPAVLFLTGNTRGQLKPCGCAEGQLGGFSPREGIFNRVDADKRILLDTGNFIEGDGQQDMLKLDAVIQSLQYLEYDVVNFNEKDLADTEGRYSFDQAPFRIISPAGDNVSFTKQIRTAEGILQVNVVSLKSDSLDEDVLDGYFSSENRTLNIVILDKLSDDIKQFLSGIESIDVVVCPTDSDSPEVLNKSIAKPLFISVGNLGKYVGKLEVIESKGNELQLTYTSIAVDKGLPGSESLDGIYQAYKEMVRLEDMLGKVTRVALSGELKYAGSDKCKTCHESEYEIWAQSKHAHAYRTLEYDNSQYDPECIECHVVGLKYESGFEDENSPKGLRNVGCEVCHGPRSEHIKNILDNPEKALKSEPQPAFECISCHKPEHSPGYQADPGGYLEKITHW